ncbi:MAG: carboxymuconolactone decarboxylase family protein [Bacillota bacterium]|nr:carboxymuconolactone decarboxylase family protein [Bacillota bacterium]
MPAFIKPPTKIPFLLRPGLWLSDKITGKQLEVPRLLSWYPKVAVSSAVMEGLVAHRDKNLSERMLKLVRMQASFSVSCPFCIDMNSSEYEKSGVTSEEMAALMNSSFSESTHTFTQREIIALEYTRLISKSPLAFPSELIESLKQNFTEREIVILASTAAQVNYWARLIQALGVPPAGFTGSCRLPEE